MPVPKSDYVHFFSTQLGQKIMAELEHRFLTAPTYTRGDAMHTAYLEGRRAAVQWLKHKADPQTQEHTDAQTEEILSDS